MNNRASLHAISLTPERFQAAPDSMARTSAFARRNQARLALPLREEVTTRQSSLNVTACNFASPRFDARVSPDAGG
ncbi:MAG: hypothetical protein ACREN8_07955 [Candidatus Dormibacteraceae bacterium]